MLIYIVVGITCVSFFKPGSLLPMRFQFGTFTSTFAKFPSLPVDNASFLYVKEFMIKTRFSNKIIIEAVFINSKKASLPFIP